MNPVLGLFVQKVVIPLIIWGLHKSGMTNWAETMALKYGLIIVHDIGGLKVYSKPSDYPQSPSEAATTGNSVASTNNLIVEQPPGV